MRLSRLFTIVLSVLLFSCGVSDSPSFSGEPVPESVQADTSEKTDTALVLSQPSTLFYVLKRDVRTRDYFAFMDSLIKALDSTLAYPVDEYILVHANPRILDTLMQQDYYLRSERGEFVEDPNALIVLHRGDSLEIPSQAKCDSIARFLRSLRIDVNIPEFTLRILRGDTLLHRCPVRIGKNKRAYLAMAGREIDLRTPIGEGEIIRIERDPWYINPVDNKRYKSTRRDDGRYTKLPRIPFLEPTIAGLRQGSLLHPTTNLSTLGKAISNGCVGMRESDAWKLYYYAPLGTKVVFRYDLEGVDENGETRELRDIYELKERSR